jgi:uncharacterized protein involved in exopolysaccharide biosynthesis
MIMNQNESQPQTQLAADEINLIDLIYPIIKHIKFLIVFCLVCVLLAGIITVFISKTYSAKAVLLLEKQGSAADSGIGAAFLQQFGIAGLMGNGGVSGDTFLAVLKSKELTREVFKHYHYFDIRGISLRNQESVIQSFSENVSANQDKIQPIISIMIEGSDPVLVADITNTYAIALDKFNQTNTITSAQRMRKYIEGRLRSANKELDEIQAAFQKFQEKNKAVSISKQAEATMMVLSELEAQRVATEVELSAKKRFFTRANIEIGELEAKMSALQKRIDQLTYSKEASVPIENEKGKVQFYIPLTQIPELDFDESKLLLNVKAKTNVVGMLTAQLEQAKLDEAKNIATINLLDPAKVPERPIKPKWILNLVVAGILSLFLGVFSIFIMEFFRKLDQDPINAAKWQEIKKRTKDAGLFMRKSSWGIFSEKAHTRSKR